MATNTNSMLAAVIRKNIENTIEDLVVMETMVTMEIKAAAAVDIVTVETAATAVLEEVAI